MKVIGPVPMVPKCEQYLIRLCFTARAEGKVLETSMKRTETTVKKKKKEYRETGNGGGCAGIRDAFRTKTADKNLTAQSMPDCPDSMSA